jgi:hypothetical protein
MRSLDAIARALISACLLALPAFGPFHLGGTTSSGSQVPLAVQIGGENLPVSAAAGYQIGPLAATLSGGAPCTSCTFSLVNSGASSDGSIPISCNAASNDFQVVSVSGTPTLENLNVIASAQVYGQAGPLSPTHGYICVKATGSGGSFTQPFSIMVRNPTFTAFAPLTIQTTSSPFTGTLATLSTVMCWTDCGQGGSPPTVTYTVGGDAACTGLSTSGASLIATAYTGSGVCHITATAAGVNTGMLGTSGSSYVAAVYIAAAPYVGPGDVASWTVWVGPYCYSAAYAAPGTNPVVTVTRERDGATLTVKCLTSGDQDTIALANFLDTSIGYGTTFADQSGSGNNMPTWGAANGSGITTRHPIAFFDAFNGAMFGFTNSNQQDRFWWSPSTYGGSGTTGSMEIVAYENSSAFGGSIIEMAATGTGSNPVTQLQFVNTSGSQLYIGPDNHTGGTSITGAGTPATLMCFMGVVNGASSLFRVNGTETTGTLATASLIKPLAFGGGFGGGSLEGFIEDAGVTSTLLSSGQRASLGQILVNHYGLGSC